MPVQLAAEHQSSKGATADDALKAYRMAPFLRRMSTPAMFFAMGIILTFCWRAHPPGSRRLWLRSKDHFALSLFSELGQD